MIGKRTFNRKKSTILAALTKELIIIFTEQLKSDGVEFDETHLRRFINDETEDLLRRAVSSIHFEIDRKVSGSPTPNLEDYYLAKLKSGLGTKEFARYDAI